MSGVSLFVIKLITSFNQRVKYRQNLQKALKTDFGWNIWSSESKTKNVNIFCSSRGDVVLIGNDNTKRISWPTWQNNKVMPGKDGITRLVKLKTSRGELLRPVQRLYPVGSVSNPSQF
ncbi:hypothetical protein HNY73_019465 [Argiope bruennichi]|uniref:DUF5641 domain-containing protein n=1 Tax=Argiope bruennichi TaxID=94029 RepID=A0A8T0E4Z6_ARGBR|nr:hypothetical protein HNY73_019465 [Argiope bruennichi]